MGSIFVPSRRLRPKKGVLDQMNAVCICHRRDAHHLEHWLPMCEYVLFECFNSFQYTYLVFAISNGRSEKRSFETAKKLAWQANHARIALQALDCIIMYAGVKPIFRSRVGKTFLNFVLCFLPFFILSTRSLPSSTAYVIDSRRKKDSYLRHCVPLFITGRGFLKKTIIKARTAAMSASSAEWFRNWLWSFHPWDENISGLMAEKLYTLLRVVVAVARRFTSKLN